MPKITIILVNYNHSRYLDERIQSLLNQTYRDFELIVVENGSTDSSAEIIRKYSEDPRIKPQFYSQNISPYRRWNEALDLALGDYLHIVCADDSCHPLLLEKLCKKLDNNPSVGLAYAQAWEIDDTGKRIRSFREWTDYLNKNRWSEDFVDTGKNECQYLFFTCTITNIGAALMRRDIFIKAGKLDEKMPFSADWMLYAKMMMISDIAYTSDHLNYHRSHSNSLRKSNDEGTFIEERLQVLHYLFNRVEAPKHFLEKIYEPTIGWWMRVMLSGKISLSRNRRIYRILKDIEPNINHQMIKYILNVSRKKIVGVPQTEPYNSSH